MTNHERRRARRVARISVYLACAGGYFAAAKLGLMLAYVNPSATAVWPATGLAIALLLVLGGDLWPAVFAGAFVANLATAGTVLTSLAIAAGNTLEAVTAVALVARYAGARHAFRRTTTVMRFAVLAAGVSTVVSATIGVATLLVAGMTTRAAAPGVWATWWLGDAVGAMTVAPAILVWIENPHIDWRVSRVVEVLALFAALVGVSLVVFGSFSIFAAAHDPLEFLCTPFIVLVAYRFGPRETSLATIGLAGIAIWGTLHGQGPFVRHTPNTSLMLLQSYVGVMSVMCLVVTTLATERRNAEDRWRHQAVVDPLTGLANYRQFMDVLHAEIIRGGRRGGGFAIIFLDLDRLKQINDRHGHVAGSRAIRRVAEVLRRSSRRLDTAARYGGDEFALILPETDAAAARQIAGRIADAVRLDPGDPALSVSVGVAIFPGDGDTVEALIAAADRVLYAEKAGRSTAGA